MSRQIKSAKKKTDNSKQQKKVRKSNTQIKRTRTSKTKRILSPEIQVIGFNLGPDHFGVDIDSVVEIVQMVEITEIPKLPEFVEGIIDVRGKIVPLINLRRMLQLGDVRYNLKTKIIISKIEDTQIGMIVDTVSEIITIQKEQILPSDEKTIPLTKFLFGIADLGQGLILLLDTGKVLSFEQRALLKKTKKINQIIERPTRGKNKESEILHKRTVELSRRTVEDNAEKKQYVTFSLGHECYGLEVDYIKEISKLFDIYFIPFAPRHIVGTINLRGAIISVIDLRKFFELPERIATKDIRIIVIEYNKMKLGFIVDSVADIVELPTNLIEPPLATIESVKADYLKGEVEWNKNLLGLIDIGNIIHAISTY